MFWFDGITLLLIVIVIVAAFLLGLWEGHCDAWAMAALRVPEGKMNSFNRGNWAL